MEKFCPEALVLSFTNPESRIVMAINYLTKCHVVGLCHGVLSARDRISRILGKPLEDLDIVSGGLNHFFWVVKVADAKTGKDLYPELRRRVLSEEGLVPPLVRKMVEVFDCFPLSSDDHIGEYLSFASEFCGLKWPYGRESQKVPKNGFGASDWLEPYIRGAIPIDEKVVHPSGELAVPIITDIEFDKGKWEPAVNMLNRERYVENLPEDAVVEVPAVVDRRGVHPVKVGPIPELLAAFCRTQISIQNLVVEAYRQRSRKLLLQALLLDPLVDSCKIAEEMLNEFLTIQSDYLPKFE